MNINIYTNSKLKKNFFSLCNNVYYHPGSLHRTFSSGYSLRKYNVKKFAIFQEMKILYLHENGIINTFNVSTTLL